MKKEGQKAAAAEKVGLGGFGDGGGYTPVWIDQKVVKNLEKVPK